jgi:hypothetical protein
MKIKVVKFKNGKFVIRKQTGVWCEECALLDLGDAKFQWFNKLWDRYRCISVEAE